MQISDFLVNFLKNVYGFFFNRDGWVTADIHITN